MANEGNHCNGNNIIHNDEKVVMEINLLKLEECFVYRIPPMRSAEGYRAEDWNLANPLATCALKILRQDDILLIQLLAERPKPNGPPKSTEQYLFAQSKVILKKNDKKNYFEQMEHYSTAVLDSSRYFVLRIHNQKTNREAQVGIGFRIRDDAMSFKMACMEFAKSLERENSSLDFPMSRNIDKSTDEFSSTLPAISNLSLKEGEKIHVQLPNAVGNTAPKKEKKQTSAVGKGGLLLKKPPSMNNTKNNDSEQNHKSDQHENPSQAIMTEKVIEVNIEKTKNDGIDHDQEEDWGDFQ